MGKRYMARQGAWHCKGLTVDAVRGVEIGVGPLPIGFGNWAEVEALLERHHDKDNLYFEVPTVAAIIQAEKEIREHKEQPQAATIYVCPFCSASFKGIDELRAHMSECPELQASGHFDKVAEEAARVEPLTVPDEGKEKEAGAEEARIRQEQAEAEAKAKEEKKARNAATYGKKSTATADAAKAAHKASKAAAKAKATAAKKPAAKKSKAAEE